MLFYSKRCCRLCRNNKVENQVRNTLNSVDGQDASAHDGVVVKSDEMVSRLRIGELDDGRVVLLADVEGSNAATRSRHCADLREVGRHRKVPDHDLYTAYCRDRPNV